MKNPYSSLLAPLSSQTGAMFGLDARIALAIFGILSVVAGVAAINVFGQASTTAMVTEFSNIKKAYTEFHLATGEHTSRFLDLIDNDTGFSGWSGPYMEGMLTDKSRQYGTYSFVEGRQDVAGVPPVECSGGGGICATWLKLTKVKDSVAAEVDKTLDSTSTANSGVFRIEFVPGPTDDVYYLIAAKGSGGSDSTATQQ
jgi:type II secretory pathway pseudopilin PulG